MIATFKIFNTKTKEVKEYSKPNFGDFGEYIEISDCGTKIFPINTDHELNTLHNGLFKDCIYTNGDWVGVLQKSFEYKDKIYKVGDIYSGLIVYFGAIYFTNDSGVYRCDTVGFAFKHMYWEEDDYDSPFFGLTPYDNFGKDTSCIDISRHTYDKNIVDEYFYKIINF